jgi:hypothetical protein
MNMKKKILTALDQQLVVFWQPAHLHSMQLRAVSMTYENGREISRKLDEFDIAGRGQISLMFELQLQISAMINVYYQPSMKARSTPDLMKVMNEMWWKNPKIFEKHPEKLLQEWQEIRAASSALTYSSEVMLLSGGRAAGKNFKGLQHLINTGNKDDGDP